MCMAIVQEVASRDTNTPHLDEFSSHVNRTVVDVLTTDIIDGCADLESHGGRATPPPVAADSTSGPTC
jgi:hypothetical protein